MQFEEFIKQRCCVRNVLVDEYVNFKFEKDVIDALFGRVNIDETELLCVRRPWLLNLAILTISIVQSA